MVTFARLLHFQEGSASMLDMTTIEIRLLSWINQQKKTLVSAFWLRWQLTALSADFWVWNKHLQIMCNLSYIYPEQNTKKSEKNPSQCFLTQMVSDCNVADNAANAVDHCIAIYLYGCYHFHSIITTLEKRMRTCAIIKDDFCSANFPLRWFLKLPLTMFTCGKEWKQFASSEAPQPIELVAVVKLHHALLEEETGNVV